MPRRNPEEQPKVDHQVNPFNYPSPEKSEAQDQLDLSSPLYDTEEKQIIAHQSAQNDELMTSEEIPTKPEVQKMQKSPKSLPKVEAESSTK